jgi:hypothetical protein
MTPVKRKPDLIGIAGAGPYPVRPALTHQRWAADLDSVGLGLGNSGEEQHGDAACRKEGSDCDGFEETHGWLLTLKLGLCGSVVGRGKARLASPLRE